LRIWNLASRKEVAACENAHASFLRGVSVTADGERVISAGDDRAVRIWDTTNGKLVWMAEGRTESASRLVG